MTYDPKEFTWHTDAMAAKADTTGKVAYPPIFNDTAMTGTYAYRPSKKEAPKAVFFWYSAKTGDLLCRIDNVPVKYGLDIWAGCSRHPISREVYNAVIDGAAWPHEIRIETEDGKTDSTLTAGPGHNSGASETDLAALVGNIDEWVNRSKVAIKKGAPKTQEDADALADLATKLKEMLDEAETKRLAATDPLYKAWKDELEKWSFIKANMPYVTNLRNLAKIFLDAEEKRRRDEARAANEAAAKAAAEQAASGHPQSVEALIPETVVPVQVRAGTRGKTLTTAKRKVVEYTDFQKAAAFFCSMEVVPPKIKEAIDQSTYQLLNAGVAVPGAKFETETVARS